MGLRSLEGVECFVPALKLNLEGTPQAQFIEVFCQCLLQYEEKSGITLSEKAVLDLQQCIHTTRKQVKAAFDRRVEVLDCIRFRDAHTNDQ